ncbi:RNA-binding protein [Thioalkalivibrio denitrificans]|uniref:RNA-binding protein n=1 Tax=Thioalkalivibrio denitrificans TaxID=108003 RepID=A0A1V3NE61_9GAMM|nr:ribosome assembly RNA-binding protein YhbY [Thioalkalivibrio denitrificans]OOG23341.1 RNA-binding protein [Thioalkalivibrio denitrificans]
MPLTDRQRKQLRTLAHPRKPVVIVGQKGLTENVIEEIRLALEHHELVKIKVNVADRDARNEAVQQICEQTGADLVQRIGFIATLFRRNPEKPGIQL